MNQASYDQAGRTAGDDRSLAQRTKSGVSTALGALVAVGIIYALGSWFYRLGERDAQSVPVIRAAAGPAKKIPENPGGAAIPHQDIKSYEMAERGGKTATASAAVIAPEPPEPKPGDRPMAELETTAPAVAPRVVVRSGESAATTPAATAAAPSQPEPATRSVTREETREESADNTRIAAAPSAVEQAPAARAPSARTETPLPTLTPAPPPGGAALTAPAAPAPAQTEGEAETDTAETDGEAEGQEQTVADEVDLIPGATELAPDRSPVAPSRPTNLVGLNKAAVQDAEADENKLAVAAATSPFQIQLAADPSRSAVIDLWGQIRSANQDILRDRALSIQTTISGGTKFYRLRVGPFANRAEATSVCQALRARNQDCIVARNS